MQKLNNTEKSTGTDTCTSLSVLSFSALLSLKAWIAIQYQQSANTCWCFDTSCTASLYVNGTTSVNGASKVSTSSMVTSVVGTCSNYPLVLTSGFSCQSVTFPSTGCTSKSLLEPPFISRDTDSLSLPASNGTACKQGYNSSFI